MTKYKVGDKFEWHGIIITITETDTSGNYIMVHCFMPAHDANGLHYPDHEWDKRQPLMDGEPLPGSWRPVEIIQRPNPGALQCWADNV